VDEKTIFLIQHGEAVDKKENPLRPLTERGKETISRMGNFLFLRDFKVDVIWHSPKLRARETAEILYSCLKLDKPLVEYKELEPEEPVRKTAKLLQNAEEKNIMLVGHLPHLSHLAGLLLTGDERQEVISFEKGSILCLNYQDIGVCVIRWFMIPSIISGVEKFL